LTASIGRKRPSISREKVPIVLFVDRIRGTLMDTSLCPRVTALPPFGVLEQTFARPRETDVRAAVFREMRKLFPDPGDLREKVVGLTMPSRGIRDIPTVVRAAVDFLKSR